MNQDTLDNANKAYNGCIHTFGLTKDIWTFRLISNEELDADARRFYESYSKLSDKLNLSMGWEPNPTWEQREKNGIRSDIYEKRCKARRQKSQDYSNSLHKTTKLILCEPYNKKEQAQCEYYKKLSDSILTVNRNKEGKEDSNGTLHCEIETDKATKTLLEHLAVCEHLRREASHMMMGYRPTDGDTKDLKKLHNCIRAYDELEEYFKHYDWLVVKNSLSCTEKKKEAPVLVVKEEYTPRPIDTSNVQLPKELDELAELIAENVHEVWAQSRMEEGWTYGKERNDELKQPPCLVPYKELPEEEKAYDCNTAFGTLKLITKLGFKIYRKDSCNL